MTKKLQTLMTVMFVLTLALGSLAQPPGSQPARVYLDVVIDDTVSMGSFGFGSDGGGTYVHGVQGVTASFLSSGVLSFKTGTTRTATAYHSTAWAIAPFLNTLDGSTTGNAYFLTFVKSELYLQTMAVGSFRCEGLIGSIPISADYTRHVGYRAGRGTITNLGYIRVTHPDANTWIMDSNSGECGANDNIARINDAKTKGKANDIFHERYYMPLRLTLTRH